MLLLNRLVAPLEGTVATLSERIIYGVPVFVPLRFADLAVLAALGLRELQARRVEEAGV